MRTTTWVWAAVERESVCPLTFHEMIHGGFEWADFEGTSLIGITVLDFDEENVELEDAAEVAMDDDLCRKLHAAINKVTERAGVQAHAYITRWNWGGRGPDFEDRDTVVGIPAFESCRV